jgi:hypothetical protein
VQLTRFRVGQQTALFPGFEHWKQNIIICQVLIRGFCSWKKYKTFVTEYLHRALGNSPRWSDTCTNLICLKADLSDIASVRKTTAGSELRLSSLAKEQKLLCLKFTLSHHSGNNAEKVITKWTEVMFRIVTGKFLHFDKGYFRQLLKILLASDVWERYTFLLYVISKFT